MGKKERNLVIGGHNYDIVIKPLEHKERGKVLYGRHSVRENTILINEEVTHSRQVETLIHEVLHAIYFNCGLEHDERVIDSLSNGLYQLGVGDYLWKKTKKS